MMYIVKNKQNPHTYGLPWGSGLPWWPDSKESICSAGDSDLIPGLGRYPGEGNGHLLQCSFLENPVDRGAWQATVHGVTKKVIHD